MRLAMVLRLLASVSLLAVTVLVMQDSLRLACLQWFPSVGSLEIPWLTARGSVPGFVVQVQSRPPGAQVEIDGQARGTTPMLANVECRNGQEVVLRVELSGFAPEARHVICREGGRLLARLELRSSSSVEINPAGQPVQ